MPRRITKTPPHLALDRVELLDEPGGPLLRARFPGPFEGREVTWQATLHAGLDRNFIEIGEDRPDGTPVTIGLVVATIDRATVRNAVIMMRRFKRLRRGRHEWQGPAPRPPDS